MDQILRDLGNALSSVFSNEIVQLGIRAIGIYIVIIWLATAFWAYQDMRHRTANPILPYLAAALIIVFTPLLFIFAAILYRIIRPHERIGEAHERMLAEEAMLAEVERIDHCLGCGYRIDDGWIVCPMCRTRLKRVCSSCGKLVGTEWSLCAWCGADFEPAMRQGAVGAGPYAAGSLTPRPGSRPASAQAPRPAPAQAAVPMASPSLAPALLSAVSSTPSGRSPYEPPSGDSVGRSSEFEPSRVAPMARPIRSVPPASAATVVSASSASDPAEWAAASSPAPVEAAAPAPDPAEQATAPDVVGQATASASSAGSIEPAPRRRASAR